MSPGCPGARYVDQAGLELGDTFVSAGIKSGAGIKVWCHHAREYISVIQRATFILPALGGEACCDPTPPHTSRFP